MVRRSLSRNDPRSYFDEAEHIAALGPRPVDRSAVQLERAAGARKERAEAPWTELAHQAHHPAGSVEEEHVERVAHEAGVNALARAEEQGASWLERRVADQASQASPGRERQAHLFRHDEPAGLVDRAQLVAGSKLPQDDGRWL